MGEGHSLTSATVRGRLILTFGSSVFPKGFPIFQALRSNRGAQRRALGRILRVVSAWKIHSNLTKLWSYWRKSLAPRTGLIPTCKISLGHPAKALWLRSTFDKPGCPSLRRCCSPAVAQPRLPNMNSTLALRVGSSGGVTVARVRSNSPQVDTGVGCG